MSLRPRSGAQVSPLTARVARASNPAGTTAMWVRDRLDGLWRDEDFATWYPRDGRPGLSPAQLATVSVLQFLLNLSDRQAAEAVRCRIDFKSPARWSWTTRASTTVCYRTSVSGWPRLAARMPCSISRWPG
ncbi:hypothetical protein GCM10010359_50130 [Streptomyces morookaense]|nr:hypothetical protein GCM10010359_50130 [Streptomyces morookaense]